MPYTHEYYLRNKEVILEKTNAYFREHPELYKSRHQARKLRDRLDGSFGPGPMAELTITTKTEGGEQTIAYTVPYVLIDKKTLQFMSDMDLIVGFGVKKQPDARLVALRDLGLN